MLCKNKMAMEQKCLNTNKLIEFLITFPYHVYVCKNLRTMVFRIVHTKFYKKKNTTSLFYFFKTF